MKRILLIIIVGLVCTHTFSQGSIVLTDKPFTFHHLKDSSVLNPLTRNHEFAKLTTAEQDVIYWTNYVRSRPLSFLHEVLNPFLNDFPEIRSAYSLSLSQQLSTLPNLSQLTPSASLQKIALEHSREIASGSTGLTHQSSKGETFQERMKRFGYESCVSENIYQGKDDALLSVILLLIDSGVPGTGHRKNILAPEMRYIGISFVQEKSPGSHFILVQNFSCE